ncbi:DUF480 domain-containing protein [Botrimarina sp.]|uniref:DUF480 domain-containing protein n=1 Tax=Botrimarina sp. TaxID=2795802 RepID=UPI0032EF8072
MPDAAREPLEAPQRRVLGVLVEKAKTTPDAYPLSLNALRTGCNQKSNRFPQMDLDEEQLERAIDSLRSKGALTVVQGDSRVERYRHRMYEWLGVEKAELAVVAELLLRGAQTVGDLRGRAARMEPIPGVSELRPILDALVGKGLIEYLTPPGRGAIVSHCFYSQSERDRVRRDLGVADAGDDPGSRPASAYGHAPTGAAADASSAAPKEATPSEPAPMAASDFAAQLADLRSEFSEEIRELWDEVERLKSRVEG